MMLLLSFRNQISRKVPEPLPSQSQMKEQIVLSFNLHIFCGVSKNFMKALDAFKKFFSIELSEIHLAGRVNIFQIGNQ